MSFFDERKRYSKKSGVNDSRRPCIPLHKCRITIRTTVLRSTSLVCFCFT